MSATIPPTTPSASATPVSPVSHGAVLATVPDAPAAAARLDPGTVIVGIVVGRDSQGLVTVRTDKGMLALASQASLPVGSTVEMEVRVTGARLQLIVLSVELPSSEKVTPWSGAGGDAAAPAPSASRGPGAPATPAAILAALSGGNLVMATVVQGTPPLANAPPGAPTLVPDGAGSGPPPSGPSAAAAPATAASPASAAAAAPSSGPGAMTPPHPGPMPSAPAGAPGGPRPGAVPVPTVSSAPAAIGMAPGPAAPTSAPAGPSAAIAAPPGAAPLPHAGTPPATLAVLARALASQPGPATPAGPLPVGAEIGLRIVGAALPGDPAPDLPARPAGATPLTGGVVVAETPAGHPVLDTPAGRLVLTMKTALPSGTVLLVELPQSLATPHTAAPTPAATPDQAMLRLSHGWPALAEALAALGDARDPAAAALAARLPQIGPRLAAGLATLMSQLASSEVGEWLGPALREALERVGRRDLTDRLRGEFQQLSRLASEPAGGDWRVMFLPLHDGQELHQMNLYLRGRRRGSDGEALDTGTRFIVEVDMTRLGPLQLDGLVHGRRFDLMLRSRAPLAPSARRDIEAIFEEARAIGGYAGTIGFQVAASFPVAPLDQAKRKRAAGGVVV